MQDVENLLQRRFSLAGKRVLYTGAAGGLGLEATLELLAVGASVIALDNDQVKIDQLKAAADQQGYSRLFVISVDLSDPSALEKTLAPLVKEAPIDVLINNAAIYPSKPFEDFSLDEMRRVHAVNVEAALICTQAVLPAMREQGWGKIINITSITLSGGWENLAPYVQSKGALVGLTRAWAREFGKWGITCNAIAPGAFPTDAEKIHPNPEEYTKFVLDHQSLKRRGTAEDIASSILFLATDASAFISGQTIAVDGGWIMT